MCQRGVGSNAGGIELVSQVLNSGCVNWLHVIERRSNSFGKVAGLVGCFGNAGEVVVGCVIAGWLSGLGKCQCVVGGLLRDIGGGLSSIGRIHSFGSHCHCIVGALLRVGGSS